MPNSHRSRNYRVDGRLSSFSEYDTTIFASRRDLAAVSEPEFVALRDTDDEPADNPSPDNLSDLDIKSTSNVSNRRSQKTGIISLESYSRRPVAFDLERWWTNTTPENRKAVGMVVICLAVFILLLGGGLYFTITGIDQIKKTPSPYICQKPECHKTAIWMESAMNNSVQPCDNFYEFVCGKTPKESTQPDLNFDYLSTGGYPIHMGETSVLSRSIKDYFKDPVLDQSIKYYQACLDYRNRERVGVSGLIDLIEDVFGTRNFMTLEDNPKSLEEIAVRLMKKAGHASFINMAFFVYPFIQIQRPAGFVNEINTALIKRLVITLMGTLGVPENSMIIQDSVLGAEVMLTIITRIQSVFKDDNNFRTKTLDAILSSQQFIDKMEQHFVKTGLCPPMGFNLNPLKVLRLFLEEDYRLDFADLMAAKQFAGIIYCLQQNSTNFSYKTINHRKTAFVTLWLLEISVQFLDKLDSTCTYFQRNSDQRGCTLMDSSPEQECYRAFFNNLGYLPFIRFLLASNERPTDYITTFEELLWKHFAYLKASYQAIPDTDIDALTKHLGTLLLSRGLHVDYIMPEVSGVLDKSAILSYLNFTDDHLKNSIKAMSYTVEKARMNWAGSTNLVPVPKWFGYGGYPRNVAQELFDFRKPMLRPAPFNELKGAGSDPGQWETFLKRKYPNYALFPLQIIVQPHLTENWPIQLAHVDRKAYRSYLQLIEASLKTRQDLVVFGDPRNAHGVNRTCYVLDTSTYTGNANKFSTQTVFDFSYNMTEDYHNSLALRLTLAKVRSNRAYFDSYRFTWGTPDLFKLFIMQVHLPKGLTKYSEEQIYFIASVRTHCRESWKSANNLIEDRWKLERSVLRMLTQIKQFAEVWNCPEKSFMNNNGYQRCL